MLDITKAHVVHQWPYQRPLLACRFDPLHRFVFTSAEDNLVQLFSLADGSVKSLPAVHDSWVQALAITPDGQIGLSGGGDGRLVWWDLSLDEPKEIRTVQAHQDILRALSISKDGSRIVSGGYDKMVHLWDTATGERIRSWNEHELNVYSVEFLSDGTRFLSGDLKGVVRLWSIDAEASLAKFEVSELHSYNEGQRVNFGGVRSLAVSADLTQIAAGGLHKSSNPLGAVHEPLAVRFPLENPGQMKNHTAEAIPGGGLWRVRFLADGTLCGVSGGSTGGWLLFWNSEQDLTIHKFQLPSLARDMDLSADGLLVATAHHDRHLRITRLTAPV